MKLVMTLMVRDEADIIGVMLEHHFAQGIDHIIATDNASTDGTTQILESFAKKGLVTLHHDPRHEKQQSEVVTKMAREAATLHNATWVINADADEFWVAEDHSKTLREAFERIPIDFKAFEVPVFDMTGAPAFRGSGLSRLVYRDRRPVERLNALGHHAHATSDVVFVADPEVEVAQGNHSVNIESQGRPQAGAGIEVLHLPWRSWEQLRRKVENAGVAYERSNLVPSPNHHGLRDYRRLRQGLLFGFYLARHPTDTELAKYPAELVEDRRLADVWKDPVIDVPVPVDRWESEASFVEPYVSLELQVNRCAEKVADLEYQLRLVRHSESENLEHISELELVQQRLVAEIETYRSSKLFRIAQKVGRLLPRRG